MSFIEYVCPKTGKTKQKYFGRNGLTTLKKEHFEELLKRREAANKAQADVEWLKQQVFQTSDQVSILQAERDSAITALNEERNSVSSIQANFNSLSMKAGEYKNTSDAQSVVLQYERAKYSTLLKSARQLVADCNILKASIEDEKRKNLEREKKREMEVRSLSLTISELHKQLDYHKNPLPTRSAFYRDPEIDRSSAQRLYPTVARVPSVSFKMPPHVRSFTPPARSSQVYDPRPSQMSSRSTKDQKELYAGLGVYLDEEPKSSDYLLNGENKDDLRSRFYYEPKRSPSKRFNGRWDDDYSY